MVDQHTPGGDEDRAGLSASSDAPMSRVRAHARTHEAALAWLAGYDPGDGKGGPIGETEGHEEFTRDVVLAAFEAGRAHKAAELALPLSSAVRLLTEASQTFRTYEGHHQDQATALLREGKENPGATQEWFEEQAGKVGDRLRKAGVNRDLAERIEEFLLIDSTPHDRLTGLALSLVQDLDALMQDSGGVYGLHLNGDPAPWETLTAEGTFSDWLGSYDRLRDHLDALFPAGGIAGTHKAVQVEDPAATVRTIEAAVAGGMIPGIDEDALSIARVGARLFGDGKSSVEIVGEAITLTNAPGMDPEVVDALRQTHDGA